jgi:hypothetical protein
VCHLSTPTPTVRLAFVRAAHSTIEGDAAGCSEQHYDTTQFRFLRIEIHMTYLIHDRSDGSKRDV